MAIQSEPMSEPQTSTLHKISIGINIFGIAGIVVAFIVWIQILELSFSVVDSISGLAKQLDSDSEINTDIDELKAKKNKLYMQMAIAVAVYSLLTFIGYKYAIVSYILNLFSLPLAMFSITLYLEMGKQMVSS